MRWQIGRRSSNIEDRRGIPGAALGGGGGLIIVGIVVALLGGDPTPFLMEGVSRSVTQLQTKNSAIPKAEQDELVDFVSVVLAGTEDTWRARFTALGGSYTEPHMVIFSGMVQSACGNAVSAMGPFYCPYDQTVYLDLDFFHDLKVKHGAPGDFAQAYVIAHEVGHHVQNQLGILDQVDRARNTMSRSQSNQTSVKTELMADCLAGIWAHETQQSGLLENGDVEEALNAASKIGDDVMQKQSRGVVVPDSFTHGSAAQRYHWFKTGFDTGSVDACNTFTNR
jgi:predicted metalloprotease